MLTIAQVLAELADSDGEGGERLSVNIHLGEAYEADLRRQLETDECIFCSEAFQNDDVLRRAGGWSVRVNQVVEKDRLGIPVDRFLLVKDPFDRDKHSAAFPGPSDWLAITSLVQWLIEESGLAPGGLFAYRAGHSLWAGRTMLHPCAHVYVPNIIRDPTDSNGRGFRAVPVDVPAG